MEILASSSSGYTTPGGMYVHESGDPAAPTVVFLHGGGVSGRMWRDHMVRLTRFHCLAPDLPGFGRSSHLPPRSRAETADVIAELIGSRAAAGRAHVVGLSWGGGVAHALLGRHPGLVDRVVIDGAGVLPWWGNRPFLLAITAISPFLHTRPVVAALAATVSMDEVGREDLRTASRRAFREAFVEGFKGGISSEEAEAPSPTLLVAGEKERVVRESNAAQAALMPNAVARFAPGLGHGWLGRDLELHLRMVEAWLTDGELPSGLLPEPRSPAGEERMRRLLERTAEAEAAPAASRRALWVGALAAIGVQLTLALAWRARRRR
jgi:pimeloyl-ACP methyl ester carboxylesterase